MIEYWQYLRYEVERLIKYHLLYRNAESNFSDAIEWIKNNKTVSNSDLDQIKKIYWFCNWTTSHVDKWDEFNSIEQLKWKIKSFVSIVEKYSLYT